MCTIHNRINNKNNNVCVQYTTEQTIRITSSMDCTYKLIKYGKNKYHVNVQEK